MDIKVGLALPDHTTAQLEGLTLVNTAVPAAKVLPIALTEGASAKAVVKVIVQVWPMMLTEAIPSPAKMLVVSLMLALMMDNPEAALVFEVTMFLVFTFAASPGRSMLDTKLVPAIVLAAILVEVMPPDTAKLPAILPELSIVKKLKEGVGRGIVSVKLDANDGAVMVIALELTARLLIKIEAASS